MSNNLDQLFKKALQNEKTEPPAYIWKAIEQKLQEKRRKKIAAWWLYGIAATALIAAFMINRLNQPTGKHFQEFAWVSLIPEQPPVLNGIETPKVILPPPKTEKQPGHPDKKIPEPVTFRKETPVNRETLHTFSIEKVQLASVPFQARLKNGTIRKDFIPLTSPEAIRNNEAYLALLQVPQPENKEGKELKVTISGHFVPAYSSSTYSSKLKNAKGSNYSRDEMNGRMNAGGGLRVSLATGKRLAFQTGIYYTRMGQKTAESVSAPQVMYPTLTSAGTRISTPWGNIKKSTTKMDNPATLTSFNNTPAGSESLEQIFETLSIPFQLRYRLNKNKIAFSLQGGLSGNVILNNKVYLKSGNEREYLGETEDIRNFSVSTDWSLGVECPISPRLKVILEPGFKYYLQSLSQNDNIDFNPYLFTLSAGVGIEF